MALVSALLIGHFIEIKKWMAILSIYQFLTKRRTITFVLPSIASILLVAFVVLGSSYLMFINLARFLSAETLYGQGMLVVGGWLHEDEFEEAYKIYQQGDYSRVIAIGMKINSSESNFKTHAERGAWYLSKLGIPEDQLGVLNVPTFDDNRSSAAILTLRKWLEKQNQLPETIDVVSTYAHARRTHTLYRLAFADTNTKTGVVAAPNPKLPLTGWWKQSGSAKTVISELAGWIKTVCCFNQKSFEKYYREYGLSINDLKILDSALNSFNA